MNQNQYDSESNFADLGMDAFSDKAVRRGFIRKVYSILLIQLSITFAFICMFLYIEEVKVYNYQNQWPFWVAFATMFVMIIVLSCCQGVRRAHPWNLICLLIFTLAESFLLGCTASRFDKYEVLLAVGICAVISLSLTLFAFQTKVDFTMCGGFLFAAVIILILFGILSAFLPVLRVFYSCAGALIFSLYLIYDTQLLMGGNHKYSISPEEYVFAALNLYLDIINLFLFLLQIVSAARGN